MVEPFRTSEDGILYTPPHIQPTSAATYESLSSSAQWGAGAAILYPPPYSQHDTRIQRAKRTGTTATPGGDSDSQEGDIMNTGLPSSELDGLPSYSTVDDLKIEGRDFPPGEPPPPYDLIPKL